MAKNTLRRHPPKVGAVCGKAARTVLCGGRSAMSVPTAIASLAMTTLDPFRSVLRTHTFAEPFDRSLNAAVAVRDLERLEADFDDTQGAQNHRGVDVSHMGDPERLAAEFADPDPEHHAAFLLAIALQRQRIMAVGHDDGCDGV